MNKKKCPLTLPDWVNYLMQEQNIYYSKFYNEVVSKLTIVIILLTILNCILVFETLFDFSPIDTNIKNVIFLFAGVFIGSAIIFMLWVIFKKLPESKKYAYCVTEHEVEIICEIMNGKEKDIDRILKRYNEIFEICKKK